jgi:hypothetical protein
MTYENDDKYRKESPESKNEKQTTCIRGNEHTILHNEGHDNPVCNLQKVHTGGEHV